MSRTLQHDGLRISRIIVQVGRCVCIANAASAAHALPQGHCNAAINKVHVCMILQKLQDVLKAI